MDRGERSGRYREFEELDEARVAAVSLLMNVLAPVVTDDVATVRRMIQVARAIDCAAGQMTAAHLLLLNLGIHRIAEALQQPAQHDLSETLARLLESLLVTQFEALLVTLLESLLYEFLPSGHECPWL
jgi:hypothetical protein